MSEPVLIVEHNVGPSEELRIDARGAITVELLDGLAELFGMELVTGLPHAVPAGSVAVFSWQGGRVRVTGQAECYLARETPMDQYANCHFALESVRIAAAAVAAGQPSHGGPGLDTVEAAAGPRVMVVGGADTGKSTLARLLTNYAVRLGRRPLLVDLDASRGAMVFPGALSVACVTVPLGAAPSSATGLAPFSLYFGRQQATDNIGLFRRLAGNLAAVADERAANDVEIALSGIVIDTPPLPKELMLQIGLSFNVDHILVLDNERLFNELQMSLARDNPAVTVVKLPKSGGTVPRDAAARERERHAAIKGYFYGTDGDAFHPYSYSVPFRALTVYRIGAPPVSAGLLPVGAAISDRDTQPIPVPISPDLLHRCLSVVDVPADWKTIPGFDLLSANALGFVVVQNVDEPAGRITILAPAPHPLPRTVLLLGSNIFLEQY